jgi:citronellyl-CoA dehydrogenase
VNKLDFFDVRALLTDEERLVQDTVARFVDAKAIPLMRECFEQHRFPKELIPEIAELGLLGPTIEGYGCAGMNSISSGIICQELERGDSGLRSFASVQSSLVMFPIYRFGSEAQKQRYLPGMARGEIIGCFGLTEPHGGSDPGNMRTRAVKNGDEWIINGSKMWITNGTRADFITLAARTGDKGYGGVSLFTFPTDVKGFQVSKKLDKVGNLASDTAVLFFEDCKIPARYLLGEENHGFYYIMTNFQGERLIAAVGAVAAMYQMVEDSLRYGNEREAFGKPLIKHQVWKHKFADYLSHIEAAKWLTYRAVELFDDPATRSTAVKEVSMAKLVAGDLMQRVAYDCQQFHGGMGYVTETHIARAWRDARLLTIGGGASEIMKEIIAKLIPGF